MLMLQSAREVVGLVIVPFSAATVGASWYASLPLYLQAELQLDLATMGQVAAAAQLVRIVVPALGTRLLPARLELLQVPVQLFAIATGILNLALPRNQAAIYLNLVADIVVVQRSIYQAIVVKIWEDNRTGALRMGESSFTIGYCIGSLWSGAAYFYGGWQLVLYCQVGSLSCAVLLELLFVEFLRPLSSYADRDKVGPTVKAGAAEEATREGDEIGADVQAGGNQLESEPTCTCQSYFVCVGLAVVSFGYHVEWSLYLVYLSTKFGWSSLTLGAGQMAGDLGGALILLATTSKPVLHHDLDLADEPSRLGSTPLCHNLFQLPFGMLWIAFLYAISFVTFTSDCKELAMFSQIVMGTLFVLLVQGCSELLVWLNWRQIDGKASTTEEQATAQRRYQHFVAASDICYVAGICLASLVSYMLLDQGYRDVPFFLSGALVAAYFTAYTAVFAADTRHEKKRKQQAQAGSSGHMGMGGVVVSRKAPQGASQETT